MTYEEWASSLPTQFKDDALWRIEAYRLGLFIGDIGWHDDADHPLAHHHDPPATPEAVERDSGRISTWQYATRNSFLKSDE